MYAVDKRRGDGIVSTNACWSCDTAFDFDGEIVNYCPACGKRQIQKCVYCNESISCLKDECPHCGRMFSRCMQCNIAYSVDEVFCLEDDCKNHTVHLCDIFHYLGVNSSRNNCFIINNKLDVESENDKPIFLSGKISPIAICNTNIIFWKNINNKCRLFCVNLKTRKNAWENSFVETINLQTDNIHYIEIDGAYVLTFLIDRLIVNALSDGSIVSTIPINGDYKAIMHNRKIYILRKEGKIQKIDVYDYPYVESHTVNSTSISGKEKVYRVLPSTDGEYVYFVDYFGNIIRTKTEGLLIETIYTNREELEIENVAYHENFLLITQKYSSGNRSISKIDLKSSMQGYIVTPIINNLNLASPKFSAHGNYIYICENMNNTLRFSKYPIIGFSGVAESHKNANTVAVTDFYSVAIDKDIYIIYKCKSRINNAIEIRRMDFQSGEYGKSLGSAYPNSPVCVVNVYDKTILAEIKTGTINIK